MEAAAPNSYDEVPYESNAFAQSHPDNLAVVATLFGMKPAAVTQCRVLELGCASGGNLIPMAMGLPQSHFVGVDYSRRQVADGKKIIDTLGLKNIELKHLSILDVDKSFGEFDFIITHGIYSWVPAAVKDKILAISKENLAPQGVAYVSYNTFPGWHMRGMIRDMMCYHSARFDKPLARARQARALLDFLAQSIKDEKSAYGLLLKAEVEVLRQQPDSYLLHDHLEEVNDPIYFYQFVERATAKGLQYLGEAELSAMMSSHLPPEVEQTLKKVVSDLVQMEQYMDFVRNRMFRQTLLCHQAITLTRVLLPTFAPSFHVAAAARPIEPQPDIRSNETAQFKAPNGPTLTVNSPLVKSAMSYLCEIAPQAVSFREALAAARQRLGLGPEYPADATGLTIDAKTLGISFIQGYTSQLVRLYLHPATYAKTVTERPLASPLARLQAATGNRVTNLRHERVQLNDFNRYLVLQLDGTRDRAALLDTMSDLVAKGTLKVNREGTQLTEPEAVRAVIGEVLKTCLPTLANIGLLVG